MAAVESTSASNKETEQNNSSTQNLLKNPRFYFIPISLGFIYSIILVIIEWNSNCYGYSLTFNWKYYLLASIAIFIIYQIYLLILSIPFCIKLLLKPLLALFIQTLFGNAILLLIWFVYGYIDWVALYNSNCDNKHITIGYICILVLYTIICLILSFQQCFMGIKVYNKRMDQKRYIEKHTQETTSKASKQSVTKKKIETTEVETPSNKLNDKATDIHLETLDNITDTMAENKLKQLVEEYNYFDTLDFSRSTIFGNSASNLDINKKDINNIEKQQIAKTMTSNMPTLDELKSHTVRTDHEVTPIPPLKKEGGGQSKSFSNLFFGEAREMSSTMFINYNKESDGDDNLMCMVCLEAFEPHDTIGKLMCNHIFHKQCIYSWLKKNATCPLCREDVEKFANVPFL